jgi:hypothetical protein
VLPNIVCGEAPSYPGKLVEQVYPVGEDIPDKTGVLYKLFLLFNNAIAFVPTKPSLINV